MTTTEQFPVRVLGGPTAFFEYGGLTFLTDPAFGTPGDYPVPGGQLTKTAPAAAAPDSLDNSWTHFTEGRDDLVAAFTAAGLITRLDLD